MDLEIGLIPGFLVLAEEGHYGRAASRLHLTSSALTKRIQRLERQLGVSLVERNPVGVLGLTAAGQRFATAAAPLLAQAEIAREAARATPPRYLIRLGIPAATNFPRRTQLAGMARDIRCSYPEARLICVNVPFSQLSRSLSENRVDVLCTIAPVRHLAVDSFPLAVKSARIGVVGSRHSLAEAEAVDVATFAAEPMLYNPRAPEEWMSPFWLGDVRPRREARLVEIQAQNQASVLRDTINGRAVITSLAMVGADLGPHLRAVALTGATPMVIHAARRHHDRRGAVQALVDAFRVLSPRDLQ